jgi:hypothetical protein
MRLLDRAFLILRQAQDEAQGWWDMAASNTAFFASPHAEPVEA